MRLKPAQGPLQAVHNRNCNVLISPKGINSVQIRSLAPTPLYNDSTTTDIVDNTAHLTIEDVAALSVIEFNGSKELRWSFSPDQQSNINRLNVDNMLLRSPERLQSPDDANFDETCSCASTSPQAEDCRFDPVDTSSSSLSSDETNEDEDMALPVKGFVNPNYPGFQHLAHTLDFDENHLNNNESYDDDGDQKTNPEKCPDLDVSGDKPSAVSGNEGGTINPIEDCKAGQEVKKSRRQVPTSLALKDIHVVEPVQIMSPIESKMADAVLSDCQEGILVIADGAGEGIEEFDQEGRVEKEDLTKLCEEKDKDTTQNLQKKRPSKLANHVKRRKDGKKDRKNKSIIASEPLGEFDIYTIETAMPHIDLEAIESHLKAAKEEEQRRRNDREEIRRRLAMGNEEDYYTDRPGRKPSLQARLQSGMNLQICFMNETASDNESPSSDSECPLTNPKPPKTSRHTNSNEKNPPQRPATLALQPFDQASSLQQNSGSDTSDFFSKQARLQTEARMALAQAKQMARMQMEIEKQKQKKSPITEMVRHSLEKVGIPFPENKRRLSRQILTEMNVAQLQVIVNDLHTQIETLNERLVKMLMSRDDLHMEQDSMLVDIEDLTRYLGAKEQVLKQNNIDNGNNNQPQTAATSGGGFKPHLERIASLVKK